MKLTIDKKVMVEKLNPLAKFKGKEVLQNTYLEVTNETVLFRVSDGEVTYTSKIKLADQEHVKVEKVGSVLLPPKVEEVIRKLSNGVFSMTILENGQIELKQGKTAAKVNAVEGEFPSLPKVEKKEEVKLSTKVLRTLCTPISFAASNNDSRPILKAIHMESDDKQFKAICTDSHRLSQKALNKPLSLPVLNIPSKPLMNVIQTLNDDDSLVLSAAGNHIVLSNDETEIYIRQLEGTYPDVSRVMSIDAVGKVKVKQSEILTAIDRALTFSKAEKNNCISIEPASDGTLKVCSSAIEGSIEEFISAEFEDVDKIEKFTINAKFLTESIKSFSNSEISFLFQGDEKPIFIVSETEPTLTQMLLPIRVH
ncbi:DNA polymerase III subunit beta [Viridibacillus arvi]|uniref:DNA polymerase III subunit beta n=1 Tax=Viridibacillus arvi TaxID=263475 RepID=UPI0034CF8233